MAISRRLFLQDAASSQAWLSSFVNKRRGPRGTLRKPWMIVLTLTFFAATVPPRPVMAQTAKGFFKQNCTGCHTIGGGRLVGPDLKDVTQKKDREWLEHFIQNPKAAMDAGDPYALQLRQEAHGIVMPTIPGLNPQMADALLKFIEAQSRSSSPLSARPKVPQQAFTAEDVRAGTQIFYGTRRLSNGGPPCISCHTLGTVSGLGGGRLGPDLTLVYQRLGGRVSLGSWLSAPATTTMQTVFRAHPFQPDEVQSLLALFESSAKNAQPAGSSTQTNFFLVGCAGALVALALMGWIWRRRVRSVRRSLVHAVRRGEA